MSDIVDVAELELLVAAQERTLQGQEGAGLSLDHFRRQLQKARPQSSTIKWRRFLEDTLIENGRKIQERQTRAPPTPSIEMSDPGIEPASSETATTRLHDSTLKSTPKPEASSGVVLPSGQPLVINVQAPPAPSPPGSLNTTRELTLLQTAELEVLRRALLGGAPSLLTPPPPRDSAEAAAKTDREERLEKQVEELGHLARTQQRLLEQLMARIQEMSEDQHKLRHWRHRHHHGKRHHGQRSDANSNSTSSDSEGEDSPDSLRPGSPVRDLIDYDEMPLPTQKKVEKPAEPDESPPLKQNMPAKMVYRNKSVEMSIPSSSRFLTLHERGAQPNGGIGVNGSSFEESPSVGKSEAVKEESTDQLISLDPDRSEASPGETSESGDTPPTGSLDRIPEEEEEEDHGGGLEFHSPTKIVVNPGRKTPSFKFSDETSEVRDSDDISEVPLHTASCSSSLGDPWTANFGLGIEHGSRSTLEELIAEGESLLLSSDEQKAHANLVRATPVFGSGRSSASISIEMRNSQRRSDGLATSEQIKREEGEELHSLVLQARRSLGLGDTTVNDIGTNNCALKPALYSIAAGKDNSLSNGNGDRVEPKLTTRKPVSAVSLDDKENDGGSGNLSIQGRDSDESNVLVLAAWKPPGNASENGKSTSEALKAPVQVDDESLLGLQGSPTPPVWEEPILNSEENLAITDKEPILSSPSVESMPAKSPDYLTGDEFPFGDPPPGSSPISSSTFTIESNSRYTHVVALRPRQEGSSKSPARYSGRPRRFRDLASARKSQHEASVHSRTSAEWSRVMENRLKHAKEEWAMIAGRSSPDSI